MTDAGTGLAIVTGVSTGIGKAVLGRLLAQGYECLVIGRTPPTKVPGVTFVRRDLSDPGDSAMAAEDIRKYLHEIGKPADILINNAGAGRPRSAGSATMSQLQAEVTLNLISPMILTAPVIEGMKVAGRGAIVNISSTAGRTGVAYLASYSAAKAGLIAFTQSIAAEYAVYGIRANCVCPGAVASEAAQQGREEISELRGLPPEDYEANMAANTGLRRLLEPSEVADVICWLATRDGRAVNGQAINVCGILSMA